jgi:ribulose-5-phosphate 4-epimerase/fuculose-1-phosphate aldolase
MEQIISKEQIEFFKENGFIQVDNVLTEEEIEELSEAMEEAMTVKGVNSVSTDTTDGSYYKVLNQKVNVWRDHGIMAKYSFHPRLA